MNEWKAVKVENSLVLSIPPITYSILRKNAPLRALLDYLQKGTIHFYGLEVLKISLQAATFLLTLKVSTLKSVFCVLSHFNHVWLCVTPWTVALQSPVSMGFTRQEYWGGLPCPSPGNLPTQGLNLHLFDCKIFGVFL